MTNEKCCVRLLLDPINPLAYNFWDEWFICVGDHDSSGLKGVLLMDRDYTIYTNWKDYLGPLGIKKARIQGGWAKTEKRKGVYDFAWLDEILFDMNAKGLLKSRDDQTVEYAKLAYYAVQNLAGVFDNHLHRVKDFDSEVDTTKSVSAFAYENVRVGFHVVTIWLDGEIPSDSTAKTKVDIVCSRIHINTPIYVDLREGSVYDIQDRNIRLQGEKSFFKEIPIYDSPILITDRANLQINE